MQQIYDSFDSATLKFRYQGTVHNITIPCLKLANYTIDELFEKQFYILIPFHIFNYEQQFSVYNKDKEKLEEFMDEQRRVVDRLNALNEQGLITGYEKNKLMVCTRNVFEKITEKYDRIKEAGEEMYGPIIVTDYDIAHEEGIKQGLKQGLEQGEKNKAKAIAKKMKQQGMDTFTITELTGLSDEEIQAL